MNNLYWRLFLYASEFVILPHAGRKGMDRIVVIVIALMFSLTSLIISVREMI